MASIHSVLELFAGSADATLIPNTEATRNNAKLALAGSEFRLPYTSSILRILQLEGVAPSPLITSTYDERRSEPTVIEISDRAALEAEIAHASPDGGSMRIALIELSDPTKLGEAVKKASMNDLDAIVAGIFDSEPKNNPSWEGFRVLAETGVAVVLIKR